MSHLALRLRPLVRGLCLLRNTGKLSQQPVKRNAGTIMYRAHQLKEPAYIHYMGEAMSFLFWYWILYHCYFEYNHLVPDHHYPDPSKFTDEELGIPPDDED